MTGAHSHGVSGRQTLPFSVKSVCPSPSGQTTFSILCTHISRVGVPPVCFGYDDSGLRMLSSTLCLSQSCLLYYSIPGVDEAICLWLGKASFVCACIDMIG